MEIDNKEWCLHILKDYVKTNPSFDGCEYDDFEEGTTPWSDGFNSNALFGRIRYRKDGRLRRTESYVLKTSPPQTMKGIYNDLSFTNEMYVYAEIFRLFATFDDNFLNIFPAYHYGRTTSFNGREQSAIILQDLSELGYRSSDSKMFLDKTHLTMMMTKLGEFHAYSYEAKRRCPLVFDQLRQRLIESQFAATKELSGLLDNSSKQGLRVLEQDAKYREKVSKIRTILSDADAYIVGVNSISNDISVICHGDYLRSNVMFAYGSEPKDIRIIDPANARYTSPANDLLGPLYLNADQTIRRDWNALVDAYYEALQNTFPDNPMVPERDRIVAEFKGRCLVQYTIASFFVPVMLVMEKQRVNPLSYIPSQYRGRGFFQIPIEELVAVIERCRAMHESDADNIIRDILVDMIDRGFV